MKSTLPTADFWKRKLAAFLHDTPTKCLNIPEHREKSRAAMSRAGFTEDEVNSYDHEADWAAAAADRLPFPASRASGLTCAFDGHRNRFHHPLDGQQQLGFSPIKSDAIGTETEQFGQPLFLADPDDSTADLWRNRFFAHWRLWCRDARERDHRLAFLPADTRIPDHTIWNHMQVVSALAGANTDGGPAFLRVQIGGVQEFIAQARNTRDLWSGSYLLSWLMVAGLRTLTERIGPDAVIFPNLLGQPLFDLHWRDDIWANLRSSPDAAPAWERLSSTTADKLTPNFPNVFLALVPANQAAALGKLVASAIQAELAENIAPAVWHQALTAGIVTAADKPRFDDQIRRALNISWQAQPWPTDLSAACALADDAPPNSPLAIAAERVAIIREMAERDLPATHRDWRYYICEPVGSHNIKTDGQGRATLNNTGLAWSILVAHQQAQLDAVRQTRVFAPAAEGGWSVGTHNTKDALIGRDEALVGGAELRQRIDRAGSYWPSLFKKNDPVAALTLLKRTWHIAYLQQVWEFRPEDFRMPNTRGIAAHDPSSDIDEEPDAEDIPPAEKYFAVLALDGDEIGKWVSGAKTPPQRDQLAAYTDGDGNATEGAVPYFKRTPELTTFLDSRRALSPSYHLQFSEALANFALHCARPIVEAFDGRLIYAGGDDVVALLPADTALSCAEALRAAFKGSAQLSALLAGTPAADRFVHSAPGFLASSDSCDDFGRGTPIPFIVPGPAAEVSVGIAIAHFKSPLQDAVRAAQAAEKRAKRATDKDGLGRGAVSLRLIKRSGEILDWGAKWGDGLALYHALAAALHAGQLSGKFPHRLCEILTPFVCLKPQPGQKPAMTDDPSFPIAAITRSEFIRLLAQHQTPAFTAATHTSLTNALDAYLATIADRSPTQIAESLIGLATAVAFAHRTRTEN